MTPFNLIPCLWRLSPRVCLACECVSVSRCTDYLPLFLSLSLQRQASDEKERERDRRSERLQARGGTVGAGLQDLFLSLSLSLHFESCKHASKLSPLLPPLVTVGVYLTRFTSLAFAVFPFLTRNTCFSPLFTRSSLSASSPSLAFPALVFVSGRILSPSTFPFS